MPGRLTGGCLVILTCAITACASQEGVAGDAGLDEGLEPDMAGDVGEADGLDIREEIAGCDRGRWEGDYVVSTPADVEALVGFTSISGSFRIVEVSSVAGLGCLQTIGGSLEVGSGSSDTYYCTSLESLEGLEGLTSIGGHLMIACNPPLGSLAPLGGITTIGEGLYVYSNSSLRTLAGLGGITSARTWLRVVGNESLESLEGLGSLATVDGDVAILRNPSLTNLDGLGGLASVGSSLQVSDNVSLPTCEARALEDRLRALGWTGECIIYGNDDTATCD